MGNAGNRFYNEVGKKEKRDWVWYFRDSGPVSGGGTDELIAELFRTQEEHDQLAELNIAWFKAQMPNGKSTTMHLRSLPQDVGTRLLAYAACSKWTNGHVEGPVIRTTTLICPEATSDRKGLIEETWKIARRCIYRDYPAYALAAHFDAVLDDSIWPHVHLLHSASLSSFDVIETICGEGLEHDDVAGTFVRMAGDRHRGDLELLRG